MGVGDLTAEELESLRHAVRKEAAAGPPDPETGVGAQARHAHLRRYDFRIPDKFPKDVLRQIAHVHDSMARALTTALSAQLRATVRVDGVLAEQRTYQEWVQDTTDPAILATFAADPLGGRALLDIEPVIAFSMLDRLLGGAGDGAVLNRPTTEIELTVLQRVLQSVLECWRDAWSHVLTLRPRILALETNPLFAQVAGPNDIVLSTSLVFGLGRREGTVRLCLPFSMVEPLVQKLAAGQWRAEVSEQPGSRAPDIRRHLAEVPVPLGVRLATVQLRLSDAMCLRPGSLVPLGIPAGAPATVEIRGTDKHVARVGRSGGRLAIQILGPGGGPDGGR